MTTEVNVLSYTQRLIVDAPTKSVSVILAGPRGPSSSGPGHVEISGDTMTGPLILSGDPTEDLGAATKQYVDNNAGGGGGGGLPTGTFIQGGWASDPDGYLIMDGSTVVGGALTHPELAAVFPGWVSNNDLILPNADGCVLMDIGSGTAGAVAGSMSRNLTEGQMPQHHHSVPQHTHTTPNHNHNAGNHLHSWSTTSTGDHDHFARFLITTSGSGTNAHLARPYGYSYDDTLRITNNSGTRGAHSHSGNTGYSNPATSNASPTTNQNAAADTGNTGSGQAVDITPKHVTVRTAVKT